MSGGPAVAQWDLDPLPRSSCGHNSPSSRHRAATKLPPLPSPVSPSPSPAILRSPYSLASFPFVCNGVHRRCLHRGSPRGLRRCLPCCVDLRVDLSEGILRPQEQHPLRLQGPDLELRPERQPRPVHAGVEPHRPDQVRDVLVLARLDRRPDRQAGGLHDPAEAHPLPGVRRQLRGSVPRQQPEPRVLRWALLDHVEAAHVRVH